MNITQRLANLVFPSPRSSSGERLPTGSAFAGQQSQPERGTSLQPPDVRCDFTFADGRRCRSQRAQFCVHHSSREEREGRANGSTDQTIVALCGDLTTATNINGALSHVFLLTAQGRIPQKQAVAFGYLSQLLLQTVPGIRSEYVSVHGYQSWQNRLKSSLTANSTEAPDPSPDGENDSGSDAVILSSPSERRISPNPSLPAKVYPQDELSPGNKVNANDGTPPTPSTTPDYASLYRRSLDLLDRKYDTTPEGRREANALLLELELLNPAPAKPRRDFFGRTVDLVRYLREGKKQKPAAAINPFQKPSAPIIPDTPAPSSPPATTSVPNEHEDNFVAPPSRRPPQPCSSGRPAETCTLGEGDSRGESHGHQELSPLNKVTEACPPSAQASSAASVSPKTIRPPEAQRHSHPKREEPKLPNWTAHTTDWYAPAAWSRPLPDPFPSRQEKLKRKLRTMSDRRRQHQNQSRAFWR